MIGGYLLGSDTEQISFEPDGVAYGRAGAMHAVDSRDPVNAHAASMGYALCGAPVRIWSDERIDPAGPEAHDGCVALAAGTVVSGMRPAVR